MFGQHLQLVVHLRADGISQGRTAIREVMWPRKIAAKFQEFRRATQLTDAVIEVILEFWLRQPFLLFYAVVRTRRGRRNGIDRTSGRSGYSDP